MLNRHPSTKLPGFPGFVQTLQYKRGGVKHLKTFEPEYDVPSCYITIIHNLQ